MARKCTSFHLKELAEKLGPDRLLRGPENLTGPFVEAVSRLAVDAAAEVRYVLYTFLLMLTFIIILFIQKFVY